MKVSYNWLKEYVGEEMPSIQKLDELLTFHAFEDVKILPDRSSDCLSHRGIAREIASLVPTVLAHDPLRTQAPEITSTSRIEVLIENPDTCARLSFAYMHGVAVGESPTWLKERLAVLGQRSINNIVDATNYVMFALGQPLHAYDADKLTHADGVWRLGVRTARDGEEITTLSKEVCALDTGMQVIVDTVTDVPLSIAGVKGGAHAEIDATTTTIILEAGNFNPQITRKTAQKLKLQTDAAKRFENGISPEVVSPALRELVALIATIAGGVCEGGSDSYPKPVVQEKVRVTHAHIESLLGTKISEDVIEDILVRIGCLSEYTDNAWVVMPPRERTDLLIPEDVIAEIGRIYGYAHVQSVLPQKMSVTEYNAHHYYNEKIRSFLVAEGFSEVITSSFRKKDTIALHNALASDKGCLRSTLRNNIYEVLDKNISNVDFLGVASVQVFEIGTVFSKQDGTPGIVEHTSLALGVRTKQNGPTPKDDERLKAVLVLLEEALGASLHAVIEKGVLECNLKEVIAQLPMPTQYDAFVPKTDVTYAPFSNYPFMSRDIALWVGEGVSAETLEAIIKEEGGDLLARFRLFDTFQKDGRTSYAFRLIFQSFERTLTDEEISPIMTRIESALREKGCEIR
jgi:phenylalanyl-tRNA synthetase beta chain